ncbi:hypothetical protein A3D80_04405 [Candidatus Roizmanbacteria bacterium RIFCSPHIGHO2_02_FULL_40_13b]|uniref:DNA polymerase III delta N-terminal domain-containing protein n=1 Tax=Candidatus Roizmanbacteria bacterium RIFCSPHIGHO2_01_FULL_39_24 TaxID=1802032 RepID=A0A1F7GFH6_9BACT|nr:MAG: hypothetical protein A2799_04415 [Candidatus Roizmanbacteria bacterium RIFCSPHIGHO2_01_FULL_39_24]OGK26409.1 MAG: hypothetical protein A3D80_04405 [Candidatus Roizmanbacteria bacterium RIFCSPHIGHO2_02_FULL_40_13b]OGK49172.1 MAG: hypothetical protein A3A56_02820 [Candidatus Roizmanbacteria bacterium RIFCSPLOWO2_01_FULL_40_32]OGK56799.1 MAG: hypothetical protein A3H83_04085 [Candidatus Roizmanbacteria bacterium RIFCSPLOWO2_02_FULL_39_8]
MITLLYGDNTAESRKKYVELRTEYTSQEVEIIELTAQNLPELSTWLYDSNMLFASKKVFFGENLISKKENRELLKKYDTKDAEIDFILWEEDTDDRTVKFVFTNAKVISHKLPTTIFTFLDGIYPGNKKESLFGLNQLTQVVDSNIIVFMLIKRIRELILVEGGKSPDKLASWQVGKLKSQAGKWGTGEKLIKFYDALYRIDVAQKTGSTAYTLKKALDILLIYSL